MINININIHTHGKLFIIYLFLKSPKSDHIPTTLVDPRDTTTQSYGQKLTDTLPPPHPKEKKKNTKEPNTETNGQDPIKPRIFYKIS